MLHGVLLVLAIGTLGGALISFRALLAGGARIKSLAGAPGDRDGPRVSVIAAARDEGPNVERALQSLLAQDYGSLEIIAVDDRSTDDTGAILDRMASRDPRLRVIHVVELPPHWLGKNNALHVAAAQASGEYLLFTDADVIFTPDAISRAVAFARAENVDHLTMAPEMDSPGVVLSLVVNFFALGFLLFYRPWHADDPARDEHVGVGAFNLVGTSLYRSFGGHSRIALRPDDDIKLGRLVKLAGGREVVVNGVGTIRVQWYSSVGELARGLRKNTFAGLNYSLPLAVGAVAVQFIGNIWPFIAIFVTAGALMWINLLAAVVFMAMYVAVARSSHSNPWLAIGYPLAALIFAYIIVVAVGLTIVCGGIEWRGTFYSLDELESNRV